jgi:23S rRNA pseudouridine1911/1915/1917 synthase
MEKLFLTLRVTDAQAGRTVRSLLRGELSMAAGLIARVKLAPDGIRLNGVRVHTDLPVRAGDTLIVRIDDMGQNPAEPVDCGVYPVYEDAYLAVLDKPAGVAVHGAAGPGRAPTVANAAAALWGQNMPFHPVSRLDRGTSGLMTVAKCGYIHDRLRRMLHTDAFCRTYLAVVTGEPSPDCGSIELPIARVGDHPARYGIDPGGLPSRTDYRTLWTNGNFSLLRVTPRTGRTHQIRVHLSAAGHPLVGDVLYGGPASPWLARPALHSASLTLRHPVTDEILSMRAPLCGDLCDLLRTVGCEPDLS